MNRPEDDGRYRMVYAAGRREITSDDPVVLLAELIPGYAELPEAYRRRARIAHADRSLERIQGRVLSAFDSSGCDSDELQTLLNSPSNRRVPSRWSAPVPLVLIDVHFPADDRQRPQPAGGGRIIWLDTRDDDAYLRSLAVAGEIFLIIRDTADASR
ncbi:hypothetical protein ACIA8K_03605 [Catenuloplanes sp. NPDC051500]|uniref:hypothetical protein n=1 Tax=Catenuloplanes sp. NPDC051500 TaxID=3363959 RepID=UPI0037B1BC8C